MTLMRAEALGLSEMVFGPTLHNWEPMAVATEYIYSMVLPVAFKWPPNALHTQPCAPWNEGDPDEHRGFGAE